MQASKIQVGTVYAIHRKDGNLARFHVEAVTTSRINNTGSPHDYVSWVDGFDHDTPLDENGKRPRIRIEPKQVLGPFEDQVELKARADAEKAADEAEKQRRTDLHQELRRHLYVAAGLTMPNDEKTWRQPIRLDSGYGVDIEWEAVEPLLEFFRDLGRN